MNPDRPVTGSLILLDANVLYPINVCDFILTASSLQLLARPIISAEILDEAFRNITANRPDLEPARLERRFKAVRTATDGHDRTGPHRFADNSMINTKDRHVLAAALHHDVDYIITNDVRLTTEITALARPPHPPPRTTRRDLTGPADRRAHRRVTRRGHRRNHRDRRPTTEPHPDRPRSSRRVNQNTPRDWHARPGRVTPYPTATGNRSL